MKIYYLPDCPHLDKEYGFRSLIVCSKCGKIRWLVFEGDVKIQKVVPEIPSVLTYRLDKNLQGIGKVFPGLKSEEIYVNLGPNEPGWLWDNRPLSPDWYWDMAREVEQFSRFVANVPDKQMAKEGWFKVLGIEVDPSAIPELEEACHCVRSIIPLRYLPGVGFEP